MARLPGRSGHPELVVGQRLAFRVDHDTVKLYGSVVLLTENYHDHRQEDCDRTNDALALFEHCLNDHDLPS